MNITVEKKAQVTVIALEGNLLTENDSSKILDQVKDSIDNGRKNLIFNLANCKFVNSTGLGALLTSLTKSRNAGGEIILTNVPDQFTKLLSITKLDSVFVKSATPESALNTLKTD